MSLENAESDTIVVRGLAQKHWMPDVEKAVGAELWCVNSPHGANPARWFQFHALEHLYDALGSLGLELLAERSADGAYGTLYMYERDILWWDEFCDAAKAPRAMGRLHAQPFPFRRFGFQYIRPYGTGSVGLVLGAIATMHHPPKVVRLTGMDFRERMGRLSEAFAVPCIEYWIGRLNGRGVVVQFNENSGLFDGIGQLYGLDGPGGHTEPEAEAVRKALGLVAPTLDTASALA